MKDIEQFYEAFLEFEDKEGLFDLEFQGIFYWQYIRYNVYTLINELKNHDRALTMQRKQTTLHEHENQLRRIDREVFKNTRLLKKKEVLVFTLGRRFYEDGYYKCTYTDEWLKSFGKSYYVLEELIPGGNFSPTHTSHLKYFDLQDYLKMHHFGNYNTDQNAAILLEVQKLINKCEKAFDLCFWSDQKSLIMYLVSSLIKERDLSLQYYENIIKKVQPLLILIVAPFSALSRMFMMEAAKRANIRVVELSHGRIGKSNLSYNFKKKTNLTIFPDYILVAGQYDVDIPRYPIDRRFIIPVGSAELESKADYYKDKFVNKDKIVITYLSALNESLLLNAVELSTLINPNKIEIIVKLHPVEFEIWEQLYPFLIGTSIKIEKSREIYYYLAMSDIVVGESSTSLYEATLFKCKILILNIGDSRPTLELVEHNMAEYILSAQEIADVLQRYPISYNSPNVSGGNCFYSDNSVKRMNDAINLILLNE